MRGFRRGIITFEILVAARLGAFGDWWAASAAHRLKKLLWNKPSSRYGG